MNYEEAVEDYDRRMRAIVERRRAANQDEDTDTDVDVVSEEEN